MRFCIPVAVLFRWLRVGVLVSQTGSMDHVAGFHSKVAKKSDGRFESNFFNSEGKRFRSMIDVARSFGLVEDKTAAPKANKKIGHKKPANNRDCENEKKRLRRELDKLLKAHRKATKALDDFQNEKKENRYPVDDDILMEEEAAKSNSGPLITPTACPAARVPDLDGFPGIPKHCVPDLLMTWDFLCTFSRALSLNPIDLDDFVSALTYTPNTFNGKFDPSTHFPPVYLAEAHLGLLKLLLQDRSSDDWWWSVLETEVTEGVVDDSADAVASTVDAKIPLIKVDMSALLDYEEDPLITASWLQSLEEVRSNSSSNSAPIKQAVKTARDVVANKWVKAYLKKALIGDTPSFTKRAVLWLVDVMKEARPDIWSRNDSKEEVLQQKAKVIEETTALMEKMHDAEAFVSVDDVESSESDDENESDDSDDEDAAEVSNPAPSTLRSGEDDKLAPVTSSIPSKPPPTLVDLLLPPAKPLAGSDLVTSCTWPALTGATVSRILHRYKRLRNEVDDSLRAFNELPPMTKEERRLREERLAVRVFTECASGGENDSPPERAANHLSSGGNYLDLSPVERLCLLRVLIDGAYDAGRVHEIVDGNYKARIEAEKQLEMEKRRAKKKAREEEAAAQKAAREKLALEARNKFLEDKRNEIEESNNESQEYTDEFIESLTEEDIIEFDEETRAEYDALPGPESFNKSEVNKMVARMHEEAAFNTDSLTVLTMNEILSREKRELEEMEERLSSFGNVDTFGMDRESTKVIDRLRRNIQDARDAKLSLPELRAEAEEALKDAMQDGTIKALRAAIRLAKQAELCGDEEETGGMWAHDLLRDAALELKAAEGRKRVVEAQKDLVAKRNKCFIRTEPMGRDRFRNRFWQFDNSESGHVWAEVDYVLKDESNGNEIMSDRKSRYVDLLANSSAVGVGAEEKEEDFVKPNQTPEERSRFVHFSRQEFHKSGAISSLAKRHWGCQTTEPSWRYLIKNLDERGSRERELKENLKEALEESRLAASGDSGKLDGSKELEGEKSKGKEADRQKSGDEHVFLAAKHSANTNESKVISLDLLEGLSSAIGQKVRLREVVDSTKDQEIAHYNVALVDGWKIIEVRETEADENGDRNGTESIEKLSTYPVWRATFERGGEKWLSGFELLDGLCRYIRWNRKDRGYFEDDASFLAYRNALGRHCGKASEAAISSTPMYLARLMMKREQELYMPLKNRSYDNNWGGKSGARNAWITTMKDYCFDLCTARDGLLTLESALFELTGGVEEEPDTQSDGKSLLNDEAARLDIELESIDKSINALWNSRESRAIFRAIVECESIRFPGAVRRCGAVPSHVASLHSLASKTTCFLALALDLLYRNCRSYLDKNKLSEPRKSFTTPAPRMTRRMNAWQKANESLYG